MPAIFDHFQETYGFTPHKAWRVSFTVPFVIILGTAFLIVVLCPDTPAGKWSEREVNTKLNSMNAVVGAADCTSKELNGVNSCALAIKTEHNSDTEKNGNITAEYTDEVIQNPTATEFINIATSPQTVALCAAYFCSFGGEIAINSILGAFYLKNFPKLSQTTSGRWAAMFGLLNVYGRPIGGIVSDVLYKYTNGNLWAKKLWIHGLGFMVGMFCIVIGVCNTRDLHQMVGLVAGLAFFMDAGNGANFGLVGTSELHECLY
jgi:NNP family nitrate/nitrite transporter-like MFS transporter